MCPAPFFFCKTIFVIPAEYRQFSKKHDLLYDTQRASVQGYRRISVKGLQNSNNSSIIKEQSATNITEITEEAISKVPKVSISGYTDEQATFIQQQHKELLRYAKDNNESKEVAFVFRKGLTDRTEYIGTDKEIDFGATLSTKGKELFVMHNHPRNSPCSYDDILELINCGEMQTIGIVKNNGSIEIVNKLPKYSPNIAWLELERNKSKYVINKTDIEYKRTVKKTLDILSKKGMIEWIK